MPAGKKIQVIFYLLVDSYRKIVLHLNDNACLGRFSLFPGTEMLKILQFLSLKNLPTEAIPDPNNMECFKIWQAMP